MSDSVPKISTPPKKCAIKKRMLAPLYARLNAGFLRRYSGKPPKEEQAESPLDLLATGMGSAIQIFPQPVTISIGLPRTPVLIRAGRRLADQERQVTAIMRKTFTQGKPSMAIEGTLKGKKPMAIEGTLKGKKPMARKAILKGKRPKQ